MSHVAAARGRRLFGPPPATTMRPEMIAATGAIWLMRSFYQAWLAMPQKLSQVGRESKTAILSQPVIESATSAPPAPISELPWGDNRLLLTKLETPAIRLWYAHKAIEHGWSRAILTHHIETQLHKCEGKSD